MYSYWIADTLSGDYEEEMFPASGSWKTVLNGVGSGSHQFMLLDRKHLLERAEWRSLTLPWAKQLVVEWNGTPVYAGLILKRVYDRDAATLTVSHATLRTIFSRRLAFAVGTYDMGDLTVTERSLAAAARAVVMACAFRTPGDPWHIPIAYPGDAAGGFSRTWENWSFTTGEEMLTEIQSMQNGPDMDFRARRTAGGTLEHEFRLGSPRLSGGVFDWLVSPGVSSVTGLKVAEDASKQLTGVFTVGEGGGADLRHGEAGHLPGEIIPYLDSTRSYSDIEDPEQLNSLAMGELVTHRHPTKQHSFGLLATEGPGPDELVLGSALDLIYQDDPFELDGTVTTYLVGVGGNMSNALTVEVQ